MVTNNATLVAEGDVNDDIYLKTIISKEFSFSITTSSEIIENRRIDSKRMITDVIIPKADILKLAERQFDAADVPKVVRDEYYKLWDEYLTTLANK